MGEGRNYPLSLYQLACCFSHTDIRAEMIKTANKEIKHALNYTRNPKNAKPKKGETTTHITIPESSLGNTPRDPTRGRNHL